MNFICLLWHFYSYSHVLPGVEWWGPNGSGACGRRDSGRFPGKNHGKTWKNHGKHGKTCKHLEKPWRYSTWTTIYSQKDWDQRWLKQYSTFQFWMFGIEGHLTEILVLLLLFFFWILPWTMATLNQAVEADGRRDIQAEHGYTGWLFVIILKWPLIHTLWQFHKASGHNRTWPFIVDSPTKKMIDFRKLC